MKKLSKKVFMVLVVLCCAFALTSPATQVQAATKTTKTAVMKKADSATKDIVSYANYYGWQETIKVTKSTKTQVNKSIRLQIPKGSYYTYTQVTKKSGEKYSTVFKRNGQNFSASEVKDGLKKYSSSKAVKAYLKAEAEAKAKTLTKYGKTMGWTASVKTTSNTKKGTAKITFKNKGYNFAATVTVTRNKKTPKVSYTNQGKKSSVKKIKATLKKYKDEFSSDDGDPEPNPNPTPVSAEALAKAAETAANELINAGQNSNWIVTSEGIGTASVKLLFSNTGWNFQAGVVAKDQSGKIVINYTLQSDSSTKEKIKKMITDYATPEKVEYIKVDEATLAALAAKETEDLVKAGEAKGYKATFTNVSAVETSMEFKNIQTKFTAGIRAIDNGKGEAEAVYMLQGVKSNKGTIVSWFEKYKDVTGKDPENPENPEKTFTREEIQAAAETARDELLAEEIVPKGGWKVDDSSEMILDDRTVITITLKNSHCTIYTGVTAEIKNGAISISFQLDGQDSKNLATVERSLILEWLTEYADKSNDDPDDPEDDGPTKEQLVADAEAVWTDLYATIRPDVVDTTWVLADTVRSSNDAEALITANFSNKDHRLYIGVRSYRNGTSIAREVLMSDTSLEGLKSCSASDIALYLVRNVEKSSNGEDPNPDDPSKTFTKEELQEAAEKAWMEVIAIADANKWNSSLVREVSDDGTIIKATFTHPETKVEFYVAIETSASNGSIQTTYKLDGKNPENLKKVDKELIIKWLEDYASKKSEDPENPTDPTDPTNPEDPTNPTDPNGPGSGSGSNGGESDQPDNPNGPVKVPDENESYQPDRPSR